MRAIQEHFFKSPKMIAVSVTVILLVVVGVSLAQLHQHIRKTIRNNLITINHSVQLSLHRQVNQEVISLTQMIEDDVIRQALIKMFQQKNISAQQRFKLRLLLAERIFPQHYSGFYLIGKNRHMLVSMKENETGMDAPAPALLAIKRLQEGEPSVITHAFQYHGSISMWLLKPVMDMQGSIIGYFALGLGQEHQFTATTLNSGTIYESGETYLVDAQGHMLSESRFQHELVDIGLLKTGQSSVLNVSVVDPGISLKARSKTFFASAELPFTVALQNVLKTHEAGWNTNGYRDYRGIQSIGVWQWDDYFNAAIITEMDKSEALSDYVYVRNMLFIVLLLVLAASLISMIEHSRLRIRIERQRFQHKNLLLESTAEAIYGLDLQGKCTFVNTAFSSKLGYTEKDVIGKNIHTLIHHSYADGKPYPKAACKIAMAQIQRKRVHQKKEVFWHKNGQAVTLEYWAQPLFENSALIGSVVSFIDLADGADTPLKSSKKQLDVRSVIPVAMPEFNSIQQSSTQQADPHNSESHVPVAANGNISPDLLPPVNTVLVVEDDAFIREVACAMLSDIGLESITAEDGEQGLRLYQQHQDEIVLVLTDLTMPKMDGKALFVQLKQINPDCKVIICSGYSAEHASQQFMDQAVTGFIQKPFMPEVFCETVQQVLQ